MNIKGCTAKASPLKARLLGGCHATRRIVQQDPPGGGTMSGEGQMSPTSASLGSFYSLSRRVSPQGTLDDPILSRTNTRHGHYATHLAKEIPNIRWRSARHVIATSITSSVRCFSSGLVNVQHEAC